MIAEEKHVRKGHFKLITPQLELIAAAMCVKYYTVLKFKRELNLERIWTTKERINIKF